MAPLRPSSAPSIRRDSGGDPGAYRGRAARHVAAIGRSDSARDARSPEQRVVIELDLKRKLNEMSTQLLRAQAGTARLEHRCAAQQRNLDQLLSAPPPQRGSPGSSDTTPAQAARAPNGSPGSNNSYQGRETAREPRVFEMGDFQKAL